ncbi:transmembrane protease serine 9-like [Culicoides brevitarsis]|uniref:transmembrane protease serine 9-like n=1 Tax=Culicoides brevitarsis TaxID=469753 RepID=UPI00307B628C
MMVELRFVSVLVLKMFRLLLTLVSVLAVVSAASLAASDKRRIIGGGPDIIDNHPYVVSVQYVNTHICGGVILCPRRVMTAAHCLNYEEDMHYYSVRAGSTYHASGGQQVGFASWQKHPSYDGHYNDIAMIRLNASLVFNSFVSAAIPMDGSFTPPSNQQYSIAGWGILGNGTSPANLHSVSIPRFNQTACEALYGGSPPLVNSNALCAGVLGSKDTCSGDSGSPLMIGSTNIVVGISAWGWGCASVTYPGVYTRVYSYLTFINNQMPNTEECPNGGPDTISNHPWVASIQYVNTHICGGVILCPTRVMTAAHCLNYEEDMRYYTVRAGSTYHASGGQVIGMYEWNKHPSYDGHYNDVAIVRLNSSLVFGTDVAAAIPMDGSFTPPSNQQYVIAGWGMLGNGSYPANLHSVSIPRFNQTACEALYGGSPPLVNSNMLCAGVLGIMDTCTGDSGGPLMVGSGNIVVGIASWGWGCASVTYPGVYMRVYSYLTFINNQLASCPT